MTAYTPTIKHLIMLDIEQNPATKAEIMQKHALSEEELLEWARNFQAAGLNGLRLNYLRERKS